MDVTMPDGTVITDVPDGTTKAQLSAKYASHLSQNGGAESASPRWDVMGDIGRAASDSAGAFVQDAKAAFPGPKAAENGPIGTLKRLGNALKVPLDALGVIASPITGLAHGVAGSALSTVLPTIPGEDKKKAADAIVDKALMAAAPRGMAAPEGLAAASENAAIANKARNAAILKNKAIDTVNRRAIEDNLTPEQVAQAQTTANAGGDQVTLMDLGDKNVRGLAGTVYRAPGPAGKQLGDFLDARDEAATPALTKDVQGSVAKGSTYNAVQDLLDSRSVAAQPAFREAFASDSIAPFETQLSSALSKATGAKGQIAKQIKAIEVNNPGALAARGAAGAEVRAKYMDLHDQLRQAESDRVATMEMFKRAQSDRTSGAPGAIWSPRLQQFLDHPEVQSGLKNGLKMEMQDAIAQNRPFKPSDYSIVGTDEKGDPIIGAVPTMKSLAVAKEGLDARVADMKDPTTGRPTKAGLSLKRFRDAFVNELDTLNPAYKTARETWSGPTQSMEAVNDGKQHFTRSESNDQLKAEFDHLSPGDKDFYRLGAAEAKIDQLERAPDSSDKSKRIINSERDRKRFRMLFPSDAAADQFIQSVARKRQAFETNNAITGNSQTAGRVAEDTNPGATALLHGARGLMHAASGDALGAVHSYFRAKRDLGLVNHPELNSEIAKLLMDPNLGAVTGQPGRLIPSLPVPKKQGSVASAALLDALLSAPGTSGSPYGKH